MKDLLVLLGKRVHELRVAKKWSQEEFADVAGLHRTYIGQVERGEKNLSLGNLVKVSVALGVTPAGLLAALDEDDVPHREMSRKQQAGQPRAIESVRRVHEIRKLLKRLKHQRNAMDQTMASLDALAIASTETATSRAAKRHSSKR